MRLWLIGLFLVLPAIELALIIKIGGLIGVWPTLALMVLSAVVGSGLMRQQGAAALADLQRAFSEFRDPTGPIAHGALILLAGALMVTPGFVTDATGLLLLLPPVRTALMRALSSRVRVTRTGFGFPPPPDMHAPEPPRGPRRDAGGHPVIDGEFIELDETPSRRPRGGPSGWTRL